MRPGSAVGRFSVRARFDLRTSVAGVSRAPDSLPFCSPGIVQRSPVRCCANPLQSQLQLQRIGGAPCHSGRGGLVCAASASPLAGPLLPRP